MSYFVIVAGDYIGGVGESDEDAIADYRETYISDETEDFPFFTYAPDSCDTSYMAWCTQRLYEYVVEHGGNVAFHWVDSEVDLWDDEDEDDDDEDDEDDSAK